jgi:hypothetical protein
MQIVVTFNDFEEMEAFAQKVLEKKQPLTAKELNESAKKTEAIINAAEAKEEAEKKAKKEEAKKSSPKTEKPAEEAPAQSDEPAEELPFAEDKKEAPAAGVTESQVKVRLSEKLKAGKKAEVKELFGKYGVEKLSELIEKHPDKLDEFYKDAEGI